MRPGYSLQIRWTIPIFILLTLFAASLVEADEWAQTDSTLLMFVGEDLSVLSIASKREERVQEAPALANVVTETEIRKYGFDTLGEALSTTPGFYVGHQDRRSRAYLRGVRDSTLFLYDGIPFSNDSSNKSVPLDRELFTSWIKRIEIVRGPGSVLWGPDAFSGVVNVVPLKGKDLNGAEVGVYGGNPGRYGGYAQWGQVINGWDAFISVNGSESDNFRDRYRTRSSDSENPVIEGSVENDKAVEVVASCSYRNLLRISGRFSHFKDYLTLKTQSGRVEPGERSEPFSMVKIDLKQELWGGDLRMHSFFNHFDLDNKEGTDELKQENDTYHLELLYDRSFWRDGLLTFGTSYRSNSATERFVSNDPFLGETKVDLKYDSDLYSVFSQLRQRLGDFDVWFGARFDSHSEYDDTFSFRAGSTWLADNDFILKLLLGTAFRTPANIQAKQSGNLDTEQVMAVELSADWNVTTDLHVRATVFHHQLRDLIQQNSEGLVSNRDSEHITGTELEATYNPTSSLELFANGTFMDSSDDPIQLEGLREDRYDPGPSSMANLGAHWNFYKNFNASLRFRFLGEREVARIVLETAERPKADAVVLGFLNVYAEDLFTDGLTAGIKIDNLWDADYKEPGNFDLIQGDPLTWRFYLQYAF